MAMSRKRRNWAHRWGWTLNVMLFILSAQNYNYRYTKYLLTQFEHRDHKSLFL